MIAERRPVGDLRARVVGGLGWKLLGQIVGQVSRIAVGIVLAHLLTPHEFGLAAMALVFTGLAAIFTDLSLGSALVQRENLTEADRSTIFWTTIAAGTVMTVIGIAVSPLVGRFFGTSAVVPLFAATSTTALIAAVGSTQNALLTKAMNFRGIEIREMAATLVGAVTAVGLALGGAGAWSIIGQNLISVACSTLLVWRLSAWRPHRIYSRESLRTLGSFGVKTLFARILAYFNLYADNLLIGRYLGSTLLGVYTLAYNVMFVPVSRISLPIQQVLYAAFVRLQHDLERMGRAWLLGNQLVTAINVPAFLGMAVVAPDFIPVVFGARWNDAVPVLQLLSLAGVAQSFQAFNWSVLQAVGRLGRLLVFMAFSTVLTVGAFALGLMWGVVGVAGLFAVARTIVGIVYTWITCSTIDLPIMRYVRSVAPAVTLSVVMAACVYVTRLALVHWGLPQAGRLLLLVVEGAAVYLALVAWRAPELVREARSVVRRGGYSAAPPA